MGAQPKLTVVIPARNAAEVIGGQLEALSRQDWDEPWEVLVVDNGSGDGTADAAAEFGDRVPALRVVSATERPGQAHALNVGVREARAEAVAFCDADDEVAPGWVAGMGDALQRHELVACRSDATKLNEPWLRETREQQPENSLSTVSFPPYAPYAGSGGLGVRRQTHERLGGFDEDMPAVFDVDYCLRAYAAGIELVLVPEALLHYRFRSGWRETFRQAKTYAVHMALVQRRHRVHQPGERRRPWLLRGWKPVLRSLGSVHRRSGRARLAWLLGWQAGRYRGSLKYRVLAD